MRASARLKTTIAVAGFTAGPVTQQACGYVALAFALSWLVWIPATRLHAGVAVVILGSAGPAVAAMLLSYCSKPAPVGPLAARLRAWSGAGAGCVSGPGSPISWSR